MCRVAIGVAKVARLRTFTALDIGSSKVVCVIVELIPNGGIEIVARGVAPCHGVSEGKLTDGKAAVEAVVAAVSEAEASGYPIGPAVVAISSENLAFRNGRGVTAVASREGEITLADQDRARESACMVGVPSDYEVVSVVTRSYSVDGQKNVVNPVGLTGVRLEAEAFVCAASAHYLTNMRRLVEKAGLEIYRNGLLPAAMASSLAVLTDDECDVGALMLDIGMGTVDLAVVTKEIGYSAVLGQGGGAISGDVAQFFNITMSEAERLVTEFGAAGAEYLDPKVLNETITATSTSGDSEVTLSREKLVEVIEARLKDIVEWSAEQLQKARNRGLPVAGVVLTGGVSFLPGIERCFSKALELPARVAAPCNVPELPKHLDSPIYSTAVGLVAFGAHLVNQDVMVEEKETPQRSKYRVVNWFWKFLELFEGMFN